MTELKLNLDNDLDTKEKLSARNFSYFGLITCLATLVLAFVFKDYLIYLLSYLDEKSRSNLLEFHVILIVLFVGVSLPILWGYTICILICSYVYSFVDGFMLVVLYSAVGMSASFFISRYIFYDFANKRVKSFMYLRALVTIIESREKGFQIIFLSRLMPLPFGLVNSLFSLTDVCYRKYIFASIIGLVPTQLILCYIGSMLKSMSDVLANENTAKTASVVFIFQLIIAIVVMYYILNAAKNELNKHIDDTKANSYIDVTINCADNGNMNCEKCTLLN